MDLSLEQTRIRLTQVRLRAQEDCHSLTSDAGNQGLRHPIHDTDAQREKHPSVFAPTEEAGTRRQPQRRINARRDGAQRPPNQARDPDEFAFQIQEVGGTRPVPGVGVGSTTNPFRPLNSKMLV